MSTITLYDIPGRSLGSELNLPCSPFTIPIRHALNIKKLPYKVVWVEFVDIQTVCKQLGAAPTDTFQDGTPKYSLPVISDSSTGAVVSNSLNIVVYLDNTYPSTTPLIPASSHALQKAFQTAFIGLLGSWFWIVLPLNSQRLLGITNQEYFKRTREEAYGKKFADFSPEGSPLREKHWKEAEAAFTTVDEWLDSYGEHREYFMKDAISFADLLVAGFLGWFRLCLGEESKEWADIVDWNGGRWKALVDRLDKIQEA